jgi:hypothetical protein
MVGYVGLYEYSSDHIPSPTRFNINASIFINVMTIISTVSHVEGQILGLGTEGTLEGAPLT